MHHSLCRQRSDARLSMPSSLLIQVASVEHPSSVEIMQYDVVNVHLLLLLQLLIALPLLCILPQVRHISVRSCWARAPALADCASSLLPRGLSQSEGPVPASRGPHQAFATGQQGQHLYSDDGLTCRGCFARRAAVAPLLLGHEIGGSTLDARVEEGAPAIFTRLGVRGGGVLLVILDDGIESLMGQIALRLAVQLPSVFVHGASESPIGLTVRIKT